MKLYIEDNQTLPAIAILPDADPAPAGYTESNTIEDWHKYGGRVLGEFKGHNYLTWRKQIGGLIVAIVQPDYSNWAGLNAAEKAIATEMILAPYALRTTIVNDQTDGINWNNLIITSQGTPVLKYTGRAQVVEKMREAVGNELRVETISKDDVDGFYKATQEHLGSYTAANTPDFKQWLTNEVGSPYENAGFEQETYWSQAREDYLLEIYNGNY